MNSFHHYPPSPSTSPANSLYVDNNTVWCYYVLTGWLLKVAHCI